MKLYKRKPLCGVHKGDNDEKLTVVEPNNSFSFLLSTVCIVFFFRFSIRMLKKQIKISEEKHEIESKAGVINRQNYNLG